MQTIDTLEPQPKSGLRQLFNLNILGYALFWVWNVIFLVFVLGGITPFVLLSLLEAVRGGLVPPVFFITAAVLTFIPVLSAILGLTVFRSSGKRLLAFGYGVEAPIMLILLFRLFGVREAMPAVTMIVVVAVLGVLTLLWWLLDRNIETRGSALTHVRGLGATLLLLIGIFAGVGLAFYAVPVAVELLRGIATLISDIFRGLPNFRLDEFLLMSLSALWFMVIALVFGLLTATLFVGMPVALIVLAVRAFASSMRALAQRHGLARPMALAGATALVCIVGFVAANQQPQRAAFALIKNPPADLSEAKARLAQRETIRAGLLNAYLAPFRYTSAEGEVTHIKDMYQRSLAFDDASASAVQRAYEFVARPFLYEPSGMVTQTMTITDEFGRDRWINMLLRDEPAEAARLYQEFFDEPINQAERETIAQSVRSTWAVDQAMAAWQAVDEREVHLVQQDITITEQGDWAEVELFEVYQNETAQREEVVYYFSLPESATVTGVWLNTRPDKTTAFEYRVSPRGAAQQIYKEEVVVRRVDPALLEQIGPRQYRLRVYPIEPRTMTWEEQRRAPQARSGDKLYLWVTWRTLSQEGSTWPLAQLTDKRNLYWDARTVRTLNGKVIPSTDEDSWMPATAPASGSIQRMEHAVTFEGGLTVKLVPAEANALPQVPADARLAVVLDRSYSMRTQSELVRRAFGTLKQLTLSTADVYLTASAWRGEGPSKVALAQFDPAQVEYIGGQRAADALAQFEVLRNGTPYDAIIVLTDGSGYEQGEPTAKPSVPNAPVWMVHLGNKMSYGYDDAMLDAIQASGGGATNTLDEALGRIAIALTTDKATMRDWADGYTWQVTTSATPATPATPTSDPFAALAARRLILAEMRRNPGKLSELTMLDQLHAIAKEQSIVSPLSSMIVLVNERQQARLDELEKGADRFQREVEEIGQTQAEVTGVPEPHEWLLMGLATLMLGWWWWRRKSLAKNAEFAK